ncbi:hypothetical protein H6761_04015 [Candidatus Nomurabacteria bacterium]|nr:hypothetical protein [Candidatus Nomurabacteria bacterium]
MTREEFAAKIRWSFIIWIAGLVNVMAMIPQLIRLIQTKQTEGLAIEMFAIYFLIQIAFAFEGYIKRSNVLVVCMTLSALVTTTVIMLIFYYRHFS